MLYRMTPSKSAKYDKNKMLADSLRPPLLAMTTEIIMAVYVDLLVGPGHRAAVLLLLNLLGAAAEGCARPPALWFLFVCFENSCLFSLFLPCARLGAPPTHTGRWQLSRSRVPPRRRSPPAGPLPRC